MAVNRAEIVDQNFQDAVREMTPQPRQDILYSSVKSNSRLNARLAMEIFESMAASRHLDLCARALRGRNEGFYTLGSTGHEGAAAVAAALRPTDTAFLHYRSGGFFMQRGRQVPGVTPIFDVLLGMVASRDEPIAGGRHKVFGSVPLNIPPQTSTIASHLPKALGAAIALARANRLGLPVPIPRASIIACSFGDASANHSTACGALNSAALASHQNLPCPLLFICEDNGIGISVRTPQGWIGTRFSAMAGIRYFSADGLDIADTYDAATQAVEFVRARRRPALLHLRLVRLLGHAGSDVEQSYRSPDEIAATEACDPLLGAARLLIEGGWLQPEDALAIYEETRTRVAALAEEAIQRARLTTAEEVMAPLAPFSAEAVQTEAARAIPTDPRAAFHDRLPEAEGPRHLAWLLNRALGDLLVKYPEMLIFGEDVARKGGVYHVTADLEKKASVGRVFNTPLDETTILGLAIGAGHLGFLPVPEIQYLAYLHNAIDQLRGEACSLQFFSNDQVRNPMVVRIAGLAYQKGFGGHFHNDNSVGALLEMPGLLVAAPSNGEDAVGLLRTLIASARVSGRVSVFIEPIALYMTRDLHEARDGKWMFTYPPADASVPVGRARVWTPEGEPAVEGAPSDLTIASYSNGLWMSLRVAKRVADETGARVRVVDIRWLKPLPLDDLEAESRLSGRLLVADECRENAGIADRVLAAMYGRIPGLRAAAVVGLDTYIPLGDAANLVLIQEADIDAAARRLLETP